MMLVGVALVRSLDPDRAQPAAHCLEAGSRNGPDETSDPLAASRDDLHVVTPTR